MLAKKAISRVFSVLFVLAFILALIGPAHATPASLAESANTIETPSLLQFAAGRHVLGFAPDKVFLAGLDHALTVEFIGGRGNAPVGTAASMSMQTSGTPALGSVTYQNMWRGVDVTYTSSQTGIAESSYILQPGARPADIRLRYNRPVQLMENGTLRFAFETGYMTESELLAFQKINGQHVPVAVRFTLNEGLVGFAVGAYNPNYALTIDPLYAWHTFYGSPADDDKARGITSDANGNLYVGGISNNTWNGPGSCVTPGISPCPLHTHAGFGGDIVVVKLNRAGVYQWHTFYGSVDYDDGGAITSDASGNVYVEGYSYTAWNGPGSCVTAGISPCPLNAHAGGFDIVVLKLDSAGVYQWHTFYGSGYSDYGNDIVRDSDGNIYVTGHSRFNWDGPNAVPPLATGNGIVVLKLTSAGAYQWHAFYGASSDYDTGNSIISDSVGNLYVAGNSHDTWNGPGSCVTEGVPPCPLHAHAGSGKFDITVLKLSSAGDYQWHTFYGSSGNDDYGSSITTDSSMNLYIAGYSNAAWNGPGAVEPLHGYTGENDIVVLKLDNTGVYQWHTFYGSAGNDYGGGIISDSQGNLYVTASSPFTWNGPNAATPVNAHAGGYDITILSLNSAGDYQWHTFYGSGYDDWGYAISEGLHVAGVSGGNWYGPSAETPLNTHAGDGVGDIIVIQHKFSDTFRSAGSGDGWVLESSEASNTGGTKDSTATTLRLGDDAADKQYRAILSFNTASLPDNAVITKVILKIRKYGLVGTNPFTTHGGLKVDIRKPYFGTGAGLALHDFQAAAKKSSVATFNATPVNNWYSAIIGNAGYPFINLTGTTQFRLRFYKDDNDDLGADYMKFFSGDYATASYRPTLIIEYYVP